MAGNAASEGFDGGGEGHLREGVLRGVFMGVGSGQRGSFATDTPTSYGGRCCRGAAARLSCAEGHGRPENWLPREGRTAPDSLAAASAQPPHSVGRGPRGDEQAREDAISIARRRRTTLKRGGSIVRGSFWIPSGGVWIPRSGRSAPRYARTIRRSARTIGSGVDSCPGGPRSIGRRGQSCGDRGGSLADRAGWFADRAE